MENWDGKSKANTTGYRIFISILNTFGVYPAYALLIFVAAYYYLFSCKSNKALWYYFRQRLHFSVGRSLVLLYCNYYWFGQAIIDRIVLMAGIKNKFTFHFDGEEHLHQMVANDKGGLLLSAHIGNWEIAGHLLQRLNTKINIVMFDGEHQQLKQYLETITGQRRAHIIVIKDSISHIYEIMNAMNNKELVCMHCDRFLPGNKTLVFEFLGAAARFPQGPFTLATKLQVPVSFVFALKESMRHYHFFATEGKVYRNNAAVAPQAVLTDFATNMADKAQAYPSQWYNYHHFWE